MSNILMTAEQNYKNYDTIYQGKIPSFSISNEDKTRASSLTKMT